MKEKVKEVIRQLGGELETKTIIVLVLLSPFLLVFICLGLIVYSPIVLLETVIRKATTPPPKKTPMQKVRENG